MANKEPFPREEKTNTTKQGTVIVRWSYRNDSDTWDAGEVGIGI